MPETMTLHERFEKFNDEYIKFERISEAERLHPGRRLCGYLKVASLLKKPAQFDVHGEHDVIYLADEGDMVELSDDDIVYLLRCGISHNSGFGCLAHFC